MRPAVAARAAAGSAGEHDGAPRDRRASTGYTGACLRHTVYGPLGDRLRNWMGVTADEFYDVSRIAIVPMGFCFPGLDANGGDLAPRRECAPAWRGPIFSAMPQIELVLAVGQYAHGWHLDGPRRSVTETVRSFARWLEGGARPCCLPLPHPSWRNNGWLKANPWFEAEVLPRLRREVRRLIG